MSNEHEDPINSDKPHTSLEEWSVAIRKTAEKREEERLKDFTARVKAGLIDPDKLKRYFEARRTDFEEARKEPVLRDEEAHKAVLRAARECMLRERTRAWFTPHSPCPDAMVTEVWSSKDLWTSKDPGFTGAATAAVTVIEDPPRITCDVYAWGGDPWKTFGPLEAHAMAAGILRFKILGQHLPWSSTIEVTPHLNYHGTSNLIAPAVESYQAFAEIDIRSRIGQDKQIPGMPETVTPWTTPYSLWKTPLHHPIWVPYGPIDYTGPVTQAKVVGDVHAQKDVYIDVWIRFHCHVVGAYSSAYLSFGGSSLGGFFDVGVCMKVLAEYAQVSGLATYWLPPAKGRPFWPRA